MAESALQFGDFLLDRQNLRLLHKGEPVPLTPKAFEVLCALASRAGQLVTKNELLDTLWPGVYVSESALVVCISEIRRTLGDSVSATRFIQTIHRRGYRFVAETVELEAALGAPAIEALATDWPSEAASATPTAPAADRLVGRQAELDRLADLYAHSRTGDRRVALVHGEPGIGKTRLVEAFLEICRDDSAPGEAPLVLRADCVRQVGPVEPFFPVLDALAGAVRQSGSRALVESLRRHAPTWLARLPWLIDEDQRDVLGRSVLGAPAGRMLRELVHALEVLSRSIAVTLVVEDLHWADVGTRDLVSALAHGRDPARILVIVTSRAAGLEDREHPLQQLRRVLIPRRLCQELPLQRLGEAEVASLLRVTFEVTSVPADLPWRLHTRTGGNPLVLIELVRHWIREGVLQRDGESLHAGSVAPEGASPLPDTVRSLVDHQIEVLDDEERAILEAASVVGESFDTETLGGILGIPSRRIESRLDQLDRRLHLTVASGFRRGCDGIASACYAFAFPLVRDHLERSLSELRFVRLHAAAAQALEARLAAALAIPHPYTGDQGDEPLHRLRARIASHLAASGNVTDALAQLEAAAQVARERAAPFDAIAMLDLALEFTRALDEASEGVSRTAIELRLREARAVSLRSTGEFRRAGEDFHRAAELARELGAVDAEVRAWLGRGNALFLVDRAAAAESFAGADQLATAGASPAIVAALVCQRAYARLRFRGWSRADSEKIREAAVRLRAAGERGLLGMAQSRVAYFALVETALDEGLAQAREAVEIAVSEGDLFEYFLAEQRRAALLRVCGRMGEALAANAAAGKLAAANGHPEWQRVFELQSAECGLELGAAAFARETVLQVLDDVRSGDHVYAVDQGWVVRGEAAIALGDATDAEAAVRVLRERAGASRPPLEWSLRPRIELLAGEAALAAGDLATAAVAVGAAIELGTAPFDRATLCRAHTLHARVGHAAGNAARAAGSLQEALALTVGTTLPHEEWRICRTFAEHHRAAGRRAKALAFARRSDDVLDHLARSIIGHGGLSGETRSAVESGLRHLRQGHA